LSGCLVGVLDGISELCAKVAWVEVMLSNGAEDDMMTYMFVGDFTGGLGRNSFYERRTMKAQKYYSSEGGLVMNNACKCSGKIQYGKERRPTPDPSFFFHRSQDNPPSVLHRS
jgi:hypothetical protein